MDGALLEPRRPRAGRHPRRLRAFTLVELLFTLSVLGILATISIPAFRHLIADTRMTSQAHTLFTTLFLARSEAVKRGQTVYVCRSDDARACVAESSWHDGWIVFADTNTNRERDPDEPLIRVQRALPPQLGLRFKGLAQGRYVRFAPDGSAWPNGTFTFCDDRGPERARAIVVFRTGRPRSTAKRADGGSLDCSWHLADRS